MSNENDGLLIESEAYISYLKRRKKFILKLALFHFALVFVFDALAIFEPTLFALPMWPGSAFNIGLIYAFVIIFSVIASTFYYSHRINQEESKFTESPNQTDKISS